MTTTAASFYIHRKGKAHGPCSLEELRTYLAYGSVQPDELVAEAGSDHWQPARQVFDSSPGESEGFADEFITNPWTWLRQRMSQSSGAGDARAALATRRRIVRYRDWEKVPPSVRSTLVLTQMVVGFCIFPPSLWLACSRALSFRVIRPTADEDGYLKTWPAAMHTVCTLLIVINAILWLWGGNYLWREYGPFAIEATATFTESIRQVVQDVISGRSQ